mmetsp:Transcript_23728/g.39608  ORF Transcript_23728/g.39608 Transcript_23728/m.39608 type:complete len:209 (+) Transcript_23728:32-658(+)
MVDYSKFDGIDTDSEDEKDFSTQNMPVPTLAGTSPSGTSTDPDGRTVEAMTKKGKEGRIKFEHGGRTIYEWDQSLSEVNIYIEPPPDLPRNMIEIVISHRHLKVGIKNTPPFIDEDMGGPCIPDDSLWTFLDGEITINLQKMNKAEAWDCALVGQSGQTVDAFTKQETKKKLMLERFQEEHPGFDFSGAEFNGEIPNAREFMGGVKHF